MSKSETTDLSSKVLGFWRRQIATLRIINLWLVFAGGMSTFFLFHDFLPAVVRMFHSRTHDVAWMIGVAALGSMVLVVGSYVWYLGVRIARGRRSSPAFPELQVAVENAVAEINSNLGLSRKRLEVRVGTGLSGAPVSILERRAKIVVIFRADFATLVTAQPRLAGAFLAHELTHPFQWDTRFGHFWFQTDRILTIALAFLALLAMLDLSRQALAELMQHHPSSAWRTAHYVALEGLAFLSFIWVSLWFFIVTRWAEYSADLSAVLTGYGAEMSELLSKDVNATHSVWRWFWRLAYPSSLSRRKRITKICGEVGIGNERRISTPTSLPFRSQPTLLEYVAALFLRVIPFFGGFMLVGCLFIGLEVWIGNLPNLWKY